MKKTSLVAVGLAASLLGGSAIATSGVAEAAPLPKAPVAKPAWTVLESKKIYTTNPWTKEAIQVGTFYLYRSTKNRNHHQFRLQLKDTISVRQPKRASGVNPKTKIVNVYHSYRVPRDWKTGGAAYFLFRGAKDGGKMKLAEADLIDSTFYTRSVQPVRRKTTKSHKQVPIQSSATGNFGMDVRGQYTPNGREPIVTSRPPALPYLPWKSSLNYITSGGSW